MRRPRLATVWLDGCSGCHMSFLDLDERLSPPVEAAIPAAGAVVTALAVSAVVDALTANGAYPSSGRHSS